MSGMTWIYSGEGDEAREVIMLLHAIDLDVLEELRAYADIDNETADTYRAWLAAYTTSIVYKTSPRAGNSRNRPEDR